MDINNEVKVLKETQVSVNVRDIVPPSGFVRMMKCPSNYWFLSDLQAFYNPDETLESEDGDFLNSKTGLYTFDGIDVWIYNQSKQGNMYLYFRSDDEKHKLEKIIQEKKSSKVATITNPVYRWCQRSGWVITDKYSTKDAENDIFGYDTYINQIEKDITNHIKYNEFLKELGEVRSINYLLYGPPGTGKTSLIRAVASKLGCAVFIVNAGNIKVEQITSVLSPANKTETPCKVKLLLFEDFDRFLQMDKVDTVLSGLLNTLDGFDDKGDTVRFFTANNKEAIFKIDALVNRMSSKFEFYYPTFEIFRKKLNRFLSYHSSYDDAKADEFVKMVIEQKITVRPFVNYVVRYLFEPDCLDQMIANIHELK